MARGTKKRKFSNNQIVVFRFSERNMVGKVSFVRPLPNRKFLYDVVGENGKLYQELEVDVNMNYCIDTYLTRLFYQAHDIDENSIPEIDDTDTEIPLIEDLASTLIESPEISDSEEEMEIDDEGLLFDLEDED